MFSGQANGHHTVLAEARRARCDWRDWRGRALTTDRELADIRKAYYGATHGLQWILMDIAEILVEV